METVEAYDGEENMSFSKKLELVAGVLTAILGLLPPFCKHGAYTVELFRLSPGLLLDAILLNIIPGVLVATGSILHAARGKTSGFVILLIGSIFLMLMTLVYVFGGAIFYWFGLGGGIIILSQAVIAILTLILALVVSSRRALD
jgi:hypothetical protein